MSILLATDVDDYVAYASSSGSRRDSTTQRVMLFRLSNRPAIRADLSEPLPAIAG